MQKRISINEIEKFLIPYEEWKTCGLPEKELCDIEKEVSLGYSIGVARHPDYGLFILGTGQGPFMIWSEQEHEWDYDGQCIILNKEYIE